jgi:hypothetical protein
MSSRPPAAALSLLVLCLATGCMTPPEIPPPLRGTPVEVGGIGSLCVLPIDSEVDLDDARRTAWHALLAEELQERHYAVVDAETTRESFGRFVREHGGLYDAFDGHGDAARSAKVSREAWHAVGEETGCRGVVHTRLVYVVAPWQYANASWDGNVASIGGGHNMVGTIAALSLHVRITDLAERELYFHTGGILPALQLRQGFMSSRFEQTSDESLVSDDYRNRYAIDLALAYLPSRSVPDSAP